MKKIIFFLFVGLAILSCNQKSPEVEKVLPTLSANQIMQDSLTAELDSIQQNGLIIGFGVCIANEKGTLYENGFGYANKDTKQKYTAQTVQNIASISKTMIGISLMKAQEMGKLKLDDPIEQYLPFKVINPFHPNKPITIRHLATHTSGINDTDQYMKHAWVMTENQDLTNVSTAYPEQRLNTADKFSSMEVFLTKYLLKNGDFYQKNNYIDFEPGERYNYSNIGATLAAVVLENATNQSFDSFSTKHILKPLGMNATGWSLKEVDVSKHSRLYRNDYTVLPFYTAITYPDGMLITSSSDMAKYMTELIKGFSGTGTLLSKESYVQLFTEQLEEKHFEEGSRRPEHPYDADYSTAIFIGHSNVGHVGHSGGDAGVGTWMYFNKKTKTGRFIVTNTDGGNDDRAKELEFYAIWNKMEAYIEKLDK